MNKNEINNKCRTKNYDIIQVLFPKGTKDLIKIVAIEKNMTLSEFIVQCVMLQIEPTNEHKKMVDEP